MTLCHPSKTKKIKQHLKKPLLSISDAKHLLTYMKENRKFIYDYRNYAIIALMMTAGLSSHEIIHLKKEDYQIKDDHHILLIKKNKRDYKDTVYLSKGVIEAIDDYLYKRRKKENPYLFISQNQTTKKGHLSRTFFYHMFQKVIGKCGLSHTNITPHVLRHTACLF